MTDGAAYAKSASVGTSLAEFSTGLGENETLLVSSAMLVNTTAAEREVSTYLASDGGAAAAGNSLGVTTIPALSVVKSPLRGGTLVPNAAVYMQANGTGCTLQLHGIATALKGRVW